MFTTSLVGYPESLTDPSYRGQMYVSVYLHSSILKIPRQSNDITLFGSADAKPALQTCLHAALDRKLRGTFLCQR